MDDSSFAAGGPPGHVLPEPAAYRQSAQDDLTHRSQELCAHCGMRPTRNTRDAAHRSGLAHEAAAV